MQVTLFLINVMWVNELYEISFKFTEIMMVTGTYL